MFGNYGTNLSVIHSFFCVAFHSSSVFYWYSILVFLWDFSKYSGDFELKGGRHE